VPAHVQLPELPPVPDAPPAPPVQDTPVHDQPLALHAYVM
jgi:hypothetical protein